MPKISVIVAAYNIEDCLGRCLDSLAQQTFEDFEAIVVDDASTDGTGALADAYGDSDGRFIVIHHDENEGLHLARRTGVRAATGEYALFLDGDDELLPDMLQQLSDLMASRPADIVHFGITVVAECGLPEGDRAAFESYVNHPSEVLEGDSIMRAIFDPSCGQQIDWRATQRLFRTTLLKRAFDLMVDTRLERAEDGYECFVISSLALTQEPFETCRGLVYHYGGGVTGTSRISAATFGRFCEQFKACVEAAEAYVGANPSELGRRCLEGMRAKNLELLANDWLVRVDAAEKREAAHRFAELWGKAAAAREAWRFVRDKSYRFVEEASLPEEGDELELLLAIAQELELDEDDRSAEAERCRSMQRAAERHLVSIERGRAFRERLDPNIRIFVTTHKHVDVPESGILQQVQVGPGLKSHRFLDALHDDEGDSITELNPLYCELTTQYWAWKNAKADYVGFCHYRRYFDFSGTFHEENDFGEIMDDFIDADAVARYGLDDESIRRCIEGYDVITTGFHDLRDFPGDFATPREHWESAPQLHMRDLELMAQIVSERHPDYAIDVEAFLGAHTSCFCNMFIMRWDIFDAYCAWLFPLLKEFCARADMTRYSHEALRTPGHLAERLLNIYYLHALRTGEGWRCKQLQCVHFTHPDRAYLTVAPIYDYRRELSPDAVVPVVLAADDNYVPMLTTTIHSLLENGDPNRFFDIVIFEKDITAQRKDEMVRHFARFENASIRFHNVWRQVRSYDLATSNEHISVETYYRFLIQEVLPHYDKVLYLDSDLIVLGDVARLYDTDVRGACLAAATDIDFVGNLCGADPARADYAREVLKLADPYTYFQAGVLVLNTAELRQLHSVREWMEIAAQGGFIYDDQDILNAECQGRVVTLAPEWNVMQDCDGRVGAIYSFAPAELFDAYQDARTHPQIIHYAGYEKPWTWVRCDFSQRYWTYARKIPFYEELVDRVAQKSDERYEEVLAERRRIEAIPPKAVREDSPLRFVVDPLAPLGSRRREALKQLGRTVNELRGHHPQEGAEG